MANDITKPVNTGLPAYLQDKRREERIGNIDRTDLIIPRIKLLQGVSPEITDFEGAKVGRFWHSVLNEDMGTELIGIPIIMRKTYVLWAPRDDTRGILARSRDAIHWEPPEGEFQVKFTGNVRTYAWKLAPTVVESGLDKFGSSRPDDPQSPPAAALTYEMLWLFPQRMDLGPAVILNTRGSIKVCQRLLSLIDAKPVDHYYQMYRIGVMTDAGPAKQVYYNYDYRSLGYAEESDGEIARSMFLQYKDVAFRASDEREEGEAKPMNGGSSHGSSQPRDENSKF